MKAGWKLFPLSDLIAVQSGFAFKSAEYSDSGHFLMRIGNVQDGYVTSDNPKFVRLNKRTALFELCDGDILTSLTGNIGRVGKVESKHLPAALNQRVARISVKRTELILPEYLYRFLSSQLFRDHLGDAGHGAAQQNVSPKEIGAISLCLPQLDEQQRIVAVLDKAFAGIATATANAQKNLINARALFERYLRSKFGELNEGNERRKVGDLIQLQRGFDITKAQQSDGIYPVVSSGGIKSFHSEAMVEGPGVVIGRKGTLGKVFYIESDYWPHDTTLWVKNFHANHPRLVYYMLQCLDVKTLDTGTANPALNRNLVHGLDVFWPTQGDQELIAKRLDRVWNDAQRLNTNLTAKLTALSELKQSLLQKTFAGELT